MQLKTLDIFHSSKSTISIWLDPTAQMVSLMATFEALLIFKVRERAYTPELSTSEYSVPFFFLGLIFQQELSEPMGDQNHYLPDHYYLYEL